MGATVVAMAVGEKQVAIAHAGDSRAYRLRDGELKKLTRDHSIAEEMRAARPEMTDEELAGFAHRNVVMRSLGSKDELEPDVYVNKVGAGRPLPAVHATVCGARCPTPKIATILQSTDDIEAGVPAAGRRRQRGRRAGQHHGRSLVRARVIEALVDDNRRPRLRRPGRRRQDHHRGGRGRAGGAARASGRWSAPSIRRRGWPTRWGRAASAPSRSRCRPTACRALGMDEPRARADSCTPCASTPRRRSSGWCWRPVADPEMQRRIFDNTIYRQITTMLTGSQEFAATLALHDFVDQRAVRSRRARHAADGERARLPGGAGAHRGRRLQPGAAPGSRARRRGARRFSFQRLRSGGALLVRRMAKLVGSRFLDDAGAFLLDFQEVLTGFLARAQAVDKLLRGPDVGFLLVLVPEVAAIDEALFFHERLRAAGIGLAGFVANRVHAAAGPRRGGRDRGGAARRAGDGGACRRDHRRRGGAAGRGRARLRGAVGVGAARARAPRRARARRADHRGAAARSRRGQPGGAARRGRAPLRRPA